MVSAGSERSRVIVGEKMIWGCKCVCRYPISPLSKVQTPTWVDMNITTAATEPIIYDFQERGAVKHVKKSFAKGCIRSSSENPD